jgi:hypothetical protein
LLSFRGLGARRSVLFLVEAILWLLSALFAGWVLGSGVLTAEALQYARSLVRLDVKRCGPEGLGANLVGQTVDSRSELVDPGVDFVEASLAVGLGLAPHDWSRRAGGECLAAGSVSGRQGLRAQQ